MLHPSLPLERALATLARPLGAPKRLLNAP
jgi:hypothetical protein